MCINICGGGRLPLVKKRPKDFMDSGYRMVVPYKFKWRESLGRVECDCKKMIEYFEPWYGYTFYHSEECAMMKHLKRYPQMENFMWDRDPRVIAQSE